MSTSYMRAGEVFKIGNLMHGVPTVRDSIKGRERCVLQDLGVTLFLEMKVPRPACMHTT